jgi:hypothetical protein
MKIRKRLMFLAKLVLNDGDWCLESIGVYEDMSE